MDIKGEISFFVKKVKSKEGEEHTICTTSIKRAFTQEGPFSRKSMDVLFDSKAFPKEKMDKLKEDVCYTMEVKEGWLTLTRFKRKGSEAWEYNFAVFVRDGTLKKSKKVDVEKREKAREEAKARKAMENPEDPLDINEEDLPF